MSLPRPIGDVRASIPLFLLSLGSQERYGMRFRARHPCSSSVRPPHQEASIVGGGGGGGGGGGADRRWWRCIAALSHGACQSVFIHRSVRYTRDFRCLANVRPRGALKDDHEGLPYLSFSLSPSFSQLSFSLSSFSRSTGARNTKVEEKEIAVAVV